METIVGATKRILLEILLNRAPAKPDSPRLAEKRRRLQEQVDKISELGGIVDVPHLLI